MQNCWEIPHSELATRSIIVNFDYPFVISIPFIQFVSLIWHQRFVSVLGSIDDKKLISFKLWLQHGSLHLNILFRFIRYHDFPSNVIVLEISIFSTSYSNHDLLPWNAKF